MTLSDPVDYLASLDMAALIAAFSVSVLLDLPRYTFGFLAVLVSEIGHRPRRAAISRLPSISVIIPGHNEAHSIRRCVLSLRQQTVRGMEIICIDDGSTDGTAAEIRRLRADGLIDVGLVCRIRSGKSSVCNLAIARARGEVIVCVDADCTFDRDAIENIVRPLLDPRVGAVSGNIAVRNAEASLVAGVQAVEYLIGISLGKRALDFLNVVACASGAFSAFRKSAVEAIGGMDVGPGEDLDLTLRLRQAGWRIRFAHDAWCLTDVPATLGGFIRQRLRWERDALRIRLRKHRRILDPRNSGASVADLVHQFDYVVTNLLVTLVFPALRGLADPHLWNGGLADPGQRHRRLRGSRSSRFRRRPGGRRQARRRPGAALRAAAGGVQRLSPPPRPAGGVCAGVDLPPLLRRRLRARARAQKGALLLIRRLRRRVPADTLHSDPRATRGRIGRWVYLALIVAFFAWLADLFMGSLLRLRADGLVVADQVSVAVPFPAQVVDTAVAAGASVAAGEPVARVASVSLAQDIALLTARNADLLVRRLELERQSRVANAVLPVARHRAGEAEAALEKIEGYRGQGDIGLSLWMQTLRDRFETRERVAELGASLDVAEGALTAVGGAIEDAASALADLRRAYNDGVVRAPIAGTAGLLVARAGEVVAPGQPLMILYRPERYVLAYIETGGLYTVEPGDPVELASGFAQTTGTITEVLPVADQLPPEFQKTFQPRQRGQVVRIALAEASSLPLFAKVTVSGRGWLPALASAVAAVPLAR